MRLVLTAGHDRARHAIALAELVRWDGHEVAGVLVARPWSWRRARALARSRGRAALGQAIARSWAPAARLAGLAARGGEDALERLCREQGIAARSLRRWAATRGVPYRSVSDLNAARAVAWLERAAPDGVLYAGGGLLRAPFLAAARGRVLNAHAGPLPEVRGMNACEWSLLLGFEPCVTVHAIELGIDTGGVLERIPIERTGGETLAELRARTAAAGVLGLRRAVRALARPLPPGAPEAERARQCFVLAPALRELLEARLARPARSSPGADHPGAARALQTLEAA